MLQHTIKLISFILMIVVYFYENCKVFLDWNNSSYDDKKCLKLIIIIIIINEAFFL